MSTEDIMLIFLSKLKEADERIKLFFDSHFEEITKSSLVPIHRKDTIEFPTKTYLIPKKLSLKDKVEYYTKDLELYLGGLNEKIPSKTEEQENVDS